MRIRRAHTLVAGLAALAASTVACSAPALDDTACSPADREVVRSISTKLTEDGVLRNAYQLNIKGGTTLVSAELHLRKFKKDRHGDILTWAVGDGDQAEFLSVDDYARESSSWPAASFGAKRTGVNKGRACTYVNLGFHHDDQGDN